MKFVGIHINDFWISRFTKRVGTGIALYMSVTVCEKECVQFENWLYRIRADGKAHRFKPIEEWRKTYCK